MRWKPTRAGIFNVWEYDDQTFDFGDGRLALRGRNGSGKSNALALLFPFVLDGVMSAARMDPMGGGRSMKSLLLGRDDDDRAGRYRYDSGTGYVWMEFGNGDAHVTVGVGASATQHRDAEPWFFVTSQRVGHDLELAENEIPLGRRQLEERITDGTVFQRADDYRAAVDRRLLGLGELRYRRVVDLLLTLRRPHLAGKLDTDHLSATLSAGLGELDPGLVDDVAHSFDDLDSMQHELEGLAASLNAVERFLPIYREHLVHAGRQRARVLVDAIIAISELDHGLNRARRELQTEEEAKRGLIRDREHAEAERDRLGREIETILLSPAYQDATALDEVRKSADRAQTSAEKAAASARGSTDQADRAVERSRRTAEEASARSDEVVAGVEEWLELARVAGIDLPSGADFDDTWATSIVAQRRIEADQMKRLTRQASEAAEKARHAEEQATRTFEKVQEAEREVDSARHGLAVQQAELAARRDGWSADLLGVSERFSALDAGHPVPGLERLWDGAASSTIDNDVEDAADGAIQAFHTADRQVGELHLAMSRSVDAALSAVEAQQRRIDELEDERRRVEREPNPGPPANPTRPDAADDDRSGVPLYVCVDFVDDVQLDDRAGLEAALGAAGILDALVTPDDGAIDRLDAALVSAWGDGNADGPSLADLLVPVAVDGLGRERIEAVLRSIPLAGHVVSLTTDGSWRLGPLAGRFAQSQPKFIGHAARERRRAERLAALDEQLLAERSALLATEQHRSELTALRQSLRDLRSAQPVTTRLSAALTAFRDWTRRLDERLSSHESARSDAEATLRAADSISLDLQRTASRLRLPTDVDAMQDVERLLSDCDSQRRGIRSMRTTLDIATRSAEQAAETAQTMRQRADDDTSAADHAGAFAVAEQSRYEQLRANVSGDAERAVEELSTARRQRGLQETAGAEAAGRLLQTDGNVVRLTERIEGFDNTRVGLEADLASAEHHFDVICSDEIADVIGVDGVDPGTDRRTAARRLLATGDVSDDVVNRMERAYREILLDGLRAGHDPSMPKVDNVDVVRVGTADGDLPIGALARQLREEHERTSQLLTKQEREIFETHLLTRVGDAIRQLLLDADAFEHRINEEMTKVPTESGLIVELRWEPTDDEQELRSAIQALRTNPELLGPDRRDALREFFMGRIADVRISEPGRSFAETLTMVLDYRAWHQFVLYARFSSGKRQRVTRTFFRGLSGGEAATLLHLPLFAAAAAQYSNGSVQGPRVIALDEAFVGIDDKMRARLMGLLTQLDLDVILTSHEFWGFYDTVPALVLYDLVRRPPTPGVYAQRFDWAADVSSTAS